MGAAGVASLAVTRAGGARVITVDRPETRNALDPGALAALYRLARALKRDRTMRAVVITGNAAAGTFVSGGDLRALAGIRTAAKARAMALAAHEALDALRALGVPLVAAVNGDAYGGGCELAAACDYRVAEEHARFHWVQARFAVTTAWGGAANLVDLVGRGAALRWLLTARPVDAGEARAAGFVDEVAPRGGALAAALALCEAIGAHPRRAVARMLTVVRAAGRMEPGAHRALELTEFGRAWASREHHEAVAAFLARRR